MPSPEKREGKLTVNLWDELSRRCYGADRDYLKLVAMRAAYGGDTDPWLDHIVKTELEGIRDAIT